MTDFDKIIDRKNTDCVKYDGHVLMNKSEELLPLWVADMDFRTAEPVTEKLRQLAEHGIYGYGLLGDGYYSAVSDWFQKHFDFPIGKKEIVTTPGVVFALANAVRAFTEKGDAVIINRPVYYPFTKVIEQNDRKVVNSPLILKNGKYEIDLEDFEQKITENNVKLYLLCSPHNPVSRVWTADELRRVGDICGRHGVIVVSDEIHCDFVWGDNRHTVFASLGEEYAESSVICTAPSKSFNLAGLQASNIIIRNRRLRCLFAKEVAGSGFTHINVMGAAACRSAYESGEDWLAELKGYLQGNIDFLKQYIAVKIPSVKLIEPEGTYLLWLDMRSLSMTGSRLDEFIEKNAGLWLDGGTMFGDEGEGFQRINIACPREILRSALEQLAEAISQL